MAVSIGSVTATLEADTRQFLRSIQQAQKALVGVGGTANKTGQAVNNAGQSMGAFAQSTENATKKLNGLQKAATAAGAAVGTAGIALTRFGHDAFGVAADVSEMNIAMEAVGKATGLGSRTITDAASRIRGMGIEMKSAQEMALLFAQNNLDLAQSHKVARVAQDLAVLSQSNSTQTAMLLAYAIQTGNSQLLKSAGISKYASEAYEDMAKKLGVTTTDLTATQRQTAVMNMVLEEGARVAGVYEAAMTEPGKVLRSFARIINDIKLEMGNTLLAGFGPMIKAAYDLSKEFSKLLREGGILHPILKQMEEAFVGLLTPATEFLKSLKNDIKGFSVMSGNLDKLSDNIKKFTPLVISASTALSLMAGRNILSVIPGLGKIAGLISPGSPLIAGLVMLVATNEDLRQSFVNVVEALAPMMTTLGTTVAGVAAAMAPLVNEIAKIIEFITRNETVVRALVAAFVAYRAHQMLLLASNGALAGGVKKVIASFKEQYRYQQTLNTMQMTSTRAVGTAASSMRVFSATTVASMRAASVAVKGFIASLGPIALAMIAITAVMNLISNWGKTQKETAARTKELSSAIVDQTEAIRELAEAGEEIKSGFDSLEEAILNTGEAGEALITTFGALGKEANLEDIVKAKDDFDGFAEAVLRANGATDKGVEKMLAAINGYNKSGSASKKAAQYVRAFGEELGLTEEQASALVGSLNDLQNNVETLDLPSTVDEAINRLVGSGAATAAMVRQATEALMLYQSVNETVLTENEKAVMIFDILNGIIAEHETRIVNLTEKYKEFATEGLPLTADELGAVNDKLRNQMRSAKGLSGDVKSVDYRMKQFFKTLEDPTVDDYIDFLEAARQNTVQLERAMFDVTQSANGFLTEVANLEGTQVELKQAGFDLYDQFMDLGYTMTTLGKSTEEVQAQQAALVSGFIASAEQSNYTRDQIMALIKELGLLENLDPQVSVFLDIVVPEEAQKLLDELGAQIQAMYTAAYGRPNMEYVKPLQDQYDLLKAMVNAGKASADSVDEIVAGMREVERSTGDANREAEELQQAIDDLAASVAGLGEYAVSEDFAARLLGASPEEIKKEFEYIALSAMDLVEVANELGLPGGHQFLKTLAAIGDKFDELAEKQEEYIGLQEELAEAIAVYDDLLSVVNSIATEYDDFLRATDGVIDETERLGEALRLYSQAESDLDSLLSTFQEFQKAEGLAPLTIGEQISEEIALYRALQNELAGLEGEQLGFRRRISDMLAPTVAGAAGRGGVLGNLRNILSQATTFRDNLIALRAKGFPNDVIQQVVEAGVVNGGKIAKRLLAMSTGEFAEFLALREQITSLGAESAQIAGEVIFGADIADAQGEVQKQHGVVQDLFAQAINQAEQIYAQQRQAAITAYEDALSKAQANLRAQGVIVAELQASLASAESYMQSLVEAIQLDLREAFNTFLGGLGGEITRLVDSLAARMEKFRQIAQAAESAASRAMDAAASANAQASAARAAAAQAQEQARVTRPAPASAGTAMLRRAAGGPLRAGQLSLVGERGPELFVPNVGGTVIPNHRLGGNTVVNYNVNVRAVGDPAEAGRQIVKQIQEYERRNGSRWRS